jgi:hypothetical protein
VITSLSANAKKPWTVAGGTAEAASNIFTEFPGILQSEKHPALYLCLPEEQTTIHNYRQQQHNVGNGNNQLLLL